MLETMMKKKGEAHPETGPAPTCELQPVFAASDGRLSSPMGCLAVMQTPSL